MKQPYKHIRRRAFQAFCDWFEDEDLELIRESMLKTMTPEQQERYRQVMQKREVRV